MTLVRQPFDPHYHESFAQQRLRRQRRTAVTITGTQFLSGAAVTVNGTSQAATFVSATQLTTTLTAAQLSTVGTLTLVVVNPDGGTSNAAAFTVLQLPLQLTPCEPCLWQSDCGNIQRRSGGDRHQYYGHRHHHHDDHSVTWD